MFSCLSSSFGRFDAFFGMCLVFTYGLEKFLGIVRVFIGIRWVLVILLYVGVSIRDVKGIVEARFGVDAVLSFCVWVDCEFFYF